MISKANIQLVKGLQDKKQRQKYNHFVVEGEKSIAELLKSSFDIVKIFALSDWLAENKAICASKPCFEVDEKDLRMISSHQSPQKALAVVQMPQVTSPDISGPFVLGLDEIQDPGNLGTMIRIADWYGIKHIVCSKGSTDVYAPKCINASMGSFLRVHVQYGDLLGFAKAYAYPLIVGTLNGVNLHEANLPKRGMLVIGNEGHGISSAIIEAADFDVRIPRFGGAESLNAAVSAGILLDNLVRPH